MLEDLSTLNDEVLYFYTNTLEMFATGYLRLEVFQHDSWYYSQERDLRE